MNSICILPDVFHSPKINRRKLINLAHVEMKCFSTVQRLLIPRVNSLNIRTIWKETQTTHMILIYSPYTLLPFWVNYNSLFDDRPVIDRWKSIVWANWRPDYECSVVEILTSLYTVRSKFVKRQRWLRYPLNLIPFYRLFEQNIFLCGGPTNALDAFVSHLNMFVWFLFPAVWNCLFWIFFYSILIWI